MTDPTQAIDRERRGISELDDATCWELLRRGRVGRLAVSIKNRPDIFPVNYRVDDDAIVIKTAPGLKLAAATLGAAVAFEIDELDEAARTGASVVVKGRADEITSLGELFGADALGVEPWASGPKNRFFRLVPDSVTGRRID